MRKLAFVGAAVFLASALATPAMAQQVGQNPGYMGPGYTGPGGPYAGRYQRGRAAYGAMWRPYHHRYMRFRHPVLGPGYVRYRAPGYGPGDVAAGAVGTAGAVAAGAVNTAGAIATAPFNNSYGYYGGPNWHPQTYAERNGFVCTPGTYFKGADGRLHICQ